MFAKPVGSYGEDHDSEEGLRFTDLKELRARSLNWSDDRWSYEQEAGRRRYEDGEHVSGDKEGVETLEYDPESGTVTYSLEIDFDEHDSNFRKGILSAFNLVGDSINVEREYGEDEFSQIYGLKPSELTSGMPKAEDQIGDNMDNIRDRIDGLDQVAQSLRRNAVREEQDQAQL